MPAQDDADELALLMFRQLLDSSRYKVEIMSDAMLAAEVVARIGEKSPAMICIAALPPGRLGAGFPISRLRSGDGVQEAKIVIVSCSRALIRLGLL